MSYFLISITFVLRHYYNNCTIEYRVSITNQVIEYGIFVVFSVGSVVMVVLVIVFQSPVVFVVLGFGPTCSNTYKIR